MRAKVQRQIANQRESELLALLEQQLAAKYAEDCKPWAEATKLAREAVAAANAQIAAVWKEKGLPEQFRPTANFYWSSRGENAMPERRAELRRAAEARVAAVKQAALTTIADQEAKDLIKILARGLTSTEAQDFLESMPTVEQLMPPIALQDLERGLAKQLPAAGDEWEEDE